MSARRCPFLAVIAAAWLAGCAAEGPFPSLAPRAVEQEPAAEPPAPAAALTPSDPATAARIAELARAARDGHGRFEAALAAARPATARAGATGSESWIEAQLAVSRAQAARTP
ncbi:MAG TPA: hypothetical protein VGW34_10780, partial [Allosphingosinicella sp.]|nr:hypothetical protein [Allosphingosinicella sp.]